MSRDDCVRISAWCSPGCLDLVIASTATPADVLDRLRAFLLVPAGEQVGLATVDGRRFDATRSLVAQGVLDGDVVVTLDSPEDRSHAATQGRGASREAPRASHRDVVDSRSSPTRWCGLPGRQGFELVIRTVTASSVLAVVALAGTVVGAEPSLVFGVTALAAMPLLRCAFAFSYRAPRAWVDALAGCSDGRCGHCGGEPGPATGLTAGDVRRPVERHARRLSSVVAGICALSLSGAVAVPMAATTTTGRVAAFGFVACLSPSVGLAARSVRHQGTKTQLLLTSSGVAALGLGQLLLVADNALRWAVLGCSAALTCATAAVAVAVRVGWTSVWWGRIADLAEGWAVALSLPAGFVALGGWTSVVHFVSR